jgi:hypothetical protein
MLHEMMEVVQRGEGTGIAMAENETLSHCELLQSCGDVVSCNGGRFEATGTSTFESDIEALEHEW